VNCATGADTSWPTVLALIFAAIAAAIATRSLLIQATEHKRLTRELAKRADFEVTVRPTGDQYTNVGRDSASLVVRATFVILRFEIGLRNIGQRAAAHTVLNVLAPDSYGDLTWTLSNGGKRENLQAPAMKTSESLEQGRGSWWISEEIERIALRTPKLRHIAFAVQVPTDGELTVPLRIKAQADDLPDDVEERVKDYTVTVSQS
jgi:hypothetical protein